LKGSPDNQGYGVWCGGSEDASNQVQDKRAHVGNRSWKVGEQLPPSRASGSNEDEATRAIPGDLVKGVEVVGDGRNSCGHDALKCVWISVIYLMFRMAGPY
jgi:hypothetical protein